MRDAEALDETTNPTKPSTHGSSTRSIAIVTQDHFVCHPLRRSDVLTIGRGLEASVRIDEATLSRIHAIVSWKDSITIEDPGSTNGIYVGERRLAAKERYVLRVGQVVELGRARLVLVEHRASLPDLLSAPTVPSSRPRLVAPKVERVLHDPVMLRLDELARCVAVGNISVLLIGETGSGKEILAETLHSYSTRADKPFLRLNCASLSETLLESELFGYERGAFTGATQGKPGLLEVADGGTVLLDEIGDMPQSLQAKLLRVLEDRKVTRVGGLRAKPIDVRFLSATNRDLEADIRRGSFRADLYYRINGVHLRIPPLRERRTEIESLASFFVANVARQFGRSVAPSISREALDRLQHHGWPGNVRELRNVIERAALLCGGDDISVEHLQLESDEMAPRSTTLPVPSGFESHPSIDARLMEDDLERFRIVDTLNRCGGNQTQAAKLLGMARNTLLARLTKYGLPRPKKHLGHDAGGHGS
jgi:transcriptional regulator with GAF, ATPase, and Fis domain